MGSWFSNYETQAEQRAPWVASTIIRDDGQSLLKDDETRRNQIPNEFAFESAADASGERSLTDDSDESEEPVLPMGVSGAHTPRRHSVAAAGRIGESDELDVHARKLLWQDLGAIQPNWCCSRCPKRGIAEPDRYVTQAGALRLLMMDGSSSKGLELFWAELLPTVFQEPMLEEEPDPSLQVYGVCVKTVNKGRLDQLELYEFKERVRKLGWTEHLRGRKMESDYFKTKGYAALAITH